jgi:hypothetical protein
MGYAIIIAIIDGIVTEENKMREVGETNLMVYTIE